MSWALFSYGASKPAKSRGGRIALCVTMLLLCLPMAVGLVYGSVVAWRDVISQPALVTSDVASPLDAIVVTLLATGLTVLSVCLATWLVRMLVLGWDGPTWRSADETATDPRRP